MRLGRVSGAAGNIGGVRMSRCIDVEIELDSRVEVVSDPEGARRRRRSSLQTTNDPDACAVLHRDVAVGYPPAARRRHLSSFVGADQFVCSHGRCSGWPEHNAGLYARRRAVHVAPSLAAPIVSDHVTLPNAAAGAVAIDAATTTPAHYTPLPNDRLSPIRPSAERTMPVLSGYADRGVVDGELQRMTEPYRRLSVRSQEHDMRASSRLLRRHPRVSSAESD